MTFDIDLLRTLLEQEEGPTLDFKRDQYRFHKASPTEKSELLKDILAFANTTRDSSAYILIGVDEVQGETSEVVGVERHLEDADLHEFVNSKTQRRVEFSYFPFSVDNCQIGVIEIPVQERPIYLKKRFGRVKKDDVYIRDGSSTGVATSAEISAMSAEFAVMDEFKQEISEVEFVSQNQESVGIEDIFVFPHLVQDSEFFFDKADRRVETIEELLNLKHALIRGDENSGKTTLCRSLFLHLIEEGQPALLVDLATVGKMKANMRYFQRIYNGQLKGEFDLWNQKENKTIVFDNLGSRDIAIIELAKKHFDRVFITTSIDNYLAYFAEDDRLADFAQVRFLPLKHTQQEELIRKWKSLDQNAGSGSDLVTDGTVDQVEREINSVIINKIVPRYPFFVLSILQTFEAFMPQDLRITAYGHCYHALIVAQLSRLGIARDDLDSCFNFLGWLAHAMRQSSSEPNTIGLEEFKKFKIGYRSRFLVKESVLNMLFGLRGAVLSEKDSNVSFCSAYGYYFFLGRHLSDNYRDNKDIVAEMVEKSYVKDNSLALIFVIHHSNSQEILDDIILHTMVTLDDKDPVSLNLVEVDVFQGLLKKLPDNIESKESVEEERKKVRDQRDKLENERDGDLEESPHDLVNDIYRALKNMEVLSQILKNKYGSIGKEKLSEMVETVLDTGLKLARVFLLDESEIEDCANYLRNRLDEEKGLTNLREGVRLLVFILVISSIERSVSSINKREISQIVEDLCTEKNTPAFDLIHALYSIDIADSFSHVHRDMVGELLNKHRRNDFIERILSWRVQHYFNTHREWGPDRHRISDPIKQSTLALIRKTR